MILRWAAVSGHALYSTTGTLVMVPYTESSRSPRSVPLPCQYPLVTGLVTVFCAEERAMVSLRFSLVALLTTASYGFPGNSNSVLRTDTHPSTLRPRLSFVAGRVLASSTIDPNDPREGRGSDRYKY